MGLVLPNLWVSQARYHSGRKLVLLSLNAHQYCHHMHFTINIAYHVFSHVTVMVFQESKASTDNIN
jgi:hypothetical protein